MFQYHLFSELRDLPPAVIRNYAATVRALADGLDVQAELVAARHDERRRGQAHRRRVLRASVHACELIDSGTDPDRAAQRAAARYRVRLDDVRLLRPSIGRRRRTRRRIATERKIMVGYRAGLTDREIGDKLGRHRQTVARLRRGVLREMEGLYGAAIP